METFFNGLRPSELAFFLGLLVIVVLSAFTSVLALVLFNYRITPKEEQAMADNKPELLGRPIIILAVINYIACKSLWINSAILAAIVVYKTLL